MTIKGKMTTYRLLSYGISLAGQLDLVVTANEVIQTPTDYGVKKFTMTVQQNTTTELELKGE